MTGSGLRESLERNQVSIYFGAVIVAAATAMTSPTVGVLEPAISPALALMPSDEGGCKQHDCRNERTRQSTRYHINQWLSSLGLRPPK